MNPAAVLSILVRSDGVTAAVARLRVLDSAARATSGNLDRVTASSNAAAASQGRLAAAANKGRAGLAAASRGAGLVALGVAGIGAAATKTAADYESSMNTLQAVSGSTGAEMRKLSRLAQQLGADIRLPGTSSQDAAEAMTEMIKAGVSVNDTMAGVRDTLVLSAAAQVSNARAAQVASNAMNIFSLRGRDLKMVTDQLANASNASSLEIEDVADAMKMAGAVFANMQGPVVGTKQAFTDLTTAIALLGNAGIRGSDAGTSLKQALLQLTGPTDKSKTAMKGLYIAARDAGASEQALRDITTENAKGRGEAIKTLIAHNKALGGAADIAYDAAGRMRPLKDIIRLVTAGTKNMTQEQKNWYITQIFGADATRSILTLMKAGPSAWDKMTQSVTKQGAAQALADAKMKGLKGSFDALMSAVQTLGIQVGTYLLPALTAIVSAVARFTAVIDPKVFLIVAGAVGGVAAAIWLVNAALAASPILLVVTGLALLGAALVTAYQRSEAFRTAVDSAFAALKVAASSVAGAFTTAVHAVSTAWGAIVGAVRTAVDATIREIQKWKTAFFGLRVITAIARAAFGPLVVIVRATLGALLPVIQAIMAQIANAFRTAWNVVKALFSGTFTALTAIVRGFGQSIHGVIQVIGGILKGDFSQIWAGIKNIFGGGIRAALGVLKGATQAFTGAAKAIGEGIVNGIKSALGNIGHVILDRLKDAANWLKDKVGGLFGWIGGAVSDVTGDGIGKAARESLPKMGKPGSLMGANRALAPIAGIAAGYGLGVSSGLRPGSTTSSGNTSYHSTGEALDIAGPPAAMLKFFRTMRSRFGSRLAELIYTPGGAGIKNGQPHTFSGQVAADHYDHVHVAMDLGRAGVGDGPGRARIGRFMGDGTGGSNVRRIAAFLKDKGFSNAQVAGILGNLRQESGFDPNARENGGRGPGHGIAQWSFGRATALKAFARRQGKPWNDLGVQLAFMMHEFRTSERGAFDAVRSARTVEAAESAFGLRFERYGVMGNRTGRQYLDLVRGISAGSGGGGSSGGGQSRTEIERLIERNQTRIDTLRRQARHLPGGREGRGRRVRIQDQISSLLQRNRRLRGQIRDLPRGAQGVSPFDQAQAAAGLGVAEIQRRYEGSITDPSTFMTPGGYDAKAASNAALALRAQQKVKGKRIREIRKALKKTSLRPATRVRLQTELAGLLPEHAELGRQRSALINPSPEILSGGREPVTQEDILNMHLAQAGLTPGDADDTAARAAMLDYRQGRYIQAQQGGDPREIAQAAQDLKAAMEESNQLAEEANRRREEEIRAMEAHTQAMNGVKDELKAHRDFATSVQATDAYTIKKYLADALFNGQVVGFSRRAFTPGGGLEFQP